MKKNKQITEGIKTVIIIVVVVIFVHLISKIVPMALLHYLGKS